MKRRARSTAGSVAAGAILVLVLVLLAASARAAYAQPDAGQDDDKARSHARAQELLEQGNELFRGGDMQGAIRLYREAYGAFQSPKLFFNIGRCEEALAQRAPAIRDLSRFLREAEDADPGVRVEAQQRVTALAAALVAVELSGAPANAAVHVDGEPAGLTPLGGPLWMEPGSHRLSVELPGRPLWVASVAGGAGAKVALAVPDADVHVAAGGAGGGASDGAHGVVPPAVVGAPPAASTDSLWRRRWWLWTALGVVAVGAATFLVVRSLECPATTCR